MRSRIALQIVASFATLGLTAAAIAQTTTTPTPPPPALDKSAPIPAPAGKGPTPPAPAAAGAISGPTPPAPGSVSGPTPLPPGSKVAMPPMPVPATAGTAGGPPIPGATALPPPTPVQSDKPETFPDKVTTLITRERAIGTGDAVVSGQAVAVHYTGWVYDHTKPDGKGAKFDSSLSPPPGRPPLPFNFMLGAGRVIKGWDQGLVGMKTRGKRTLIIPPALAYGDRQGLPFPPGSTLLFDVELLNVLSPPPAAPAAAPAAAPVSPATPPKMK
jgi:FKBP-type peptidyl-prolyl cis-trans isomerase FkpA